jgi:putative glutamine amidotransferase
MTSLTRRPLIGISGRRWPASRLAEYFPSSLHDAELDVHFTEYATAVAGAGGLPISLTRDAEVDDVVSRLDGVVISGGADVDPTFYGEAPEDGLGSIEPDRDAWELAVIQSALRQRVPLLGICRGAQLMNVAFGGTLVQHVGRDEGAGHPRFEEDRSIAAHPIMTVPGSLAASLYGPTAQVNSLHHQTLGRVGDGLVASGHADDGVIETVEVPGCAVFGVQWHPEMMKDQPDPALVWLVKSAAAFAAGR